MEYGDNISRKAAIEAVNSLTYPSSLMDVKRKLIELPPAEPHTYRGVTLNDVMMYFDSLEGNEDAWTEFCSCLECRGWGLYHIRSATDKNVETTDARQDFMDIVYEELEDDPDNNRANRIIWAADGYAERQVDDALQVIEELQSAQLGTNLAEVGTRSVRGYPIDADALMEKVAEEYGERARDMLYRIIRDMPPVTPKQRTGKWERHYSRPNVYADLCWHCSACGYYHADNWTNKFKYCPNCGAKMTEGDSE